MKIHVEFYNRLTGHLEHNGIYDSLEDAFADAYGRVLVVTAIFKETN